MVREFSTEQHRKHFAEFCRWELASGGPDPQLAMVAYMARQQEVNEEEQLWRAFCYIGPYNVPYGEVLWRHWSYRDLADDEKGIIKAGLRNWLDAAFNADKITTRIERRTVRRADWLHEYLMGARRFIWHDWPELVDECLSLHPHQAYEVAWQKVTALPRIGRYAAIKLIEYLRRYQGLMVLTPDIRPKDAWSPRHTLGYIWPDRNLGNRDNSPEALTVASQACIDALTLLKHDYDVTIDMFQLQVLLCEYRESWEKGKQYPGRSLDSELGYARKAELDWAYNSGIWRARRDLFPLQHLGEHQGWEGPRKPVAGCLRDHGYTWTDLKYDFIKTTDMDEPVMWRGSDGSR